MESTDKLLVFLGMGKSEPTVSTIGKSLTNVHMRVISTKIHWCRIGTPCFKYSGAHPSCPGARFAFKALKPESNSSRVNISSSTESDYKEYEFNATNLPQFNGFQIKIVMSGTNFAYVPKIRDLRAIASI